MLELLKNKRILVVVAHPDDELLGLGATINKLKSEYNCNIQVLILGEGLSARLNDNNTKSVVNELKIHHENMIKATKIVGYNSVKSYDFPDNRFDTVPLLDIIKVIEKEKSYFQPNIVFTHHGGDINIDHRITFNAVLTAVRPLKDEVVSTIFTFETPSSTEWQAFNYPNYFKPNVYVEISKNNLDTKIKGMQHYEYESRDFPHPRSPKALEIIARKHGITVGYEYAEAFMLIRSK